VEAKMDIAMCTNQEVTEAIRKRQDSQEAKEAMIKTSKEQMKASQEEMKATVRASQEKVDATINSIGSKLEETVKTQVEDVLSVDQWTQGLSEELNAKKCHWGYKHPSICGSELSVTT
jgi:translation elongation factor EF-Tu-like GTPase